MSEGGPATSNLTSNDPDIRDLNDSRPYVRAQAATNLGGVLELPAVEALLTATEDRDDTVRWRAVASLFKTADSAAGAREGVDNPTGIVLKRLRGAAPSLGALLRDSSADVRRNTADLLGVLKERESLPNTMPPPVEAVKTPPGAPSTTAPAKVPRPRAKAKPDQTRAIPLPPPVARPTSPVIAVVRNEDSHGTLLKLIRTITMTPPPATEDEARRWFLEYLKTLHAEGPTGRDVAVFAYVVPSAQHQTSQWYIMGKRLFNAPAPEIKVNAEALRAVAAGSSNASPPTDRKKIFHELVASESKALKEADVRYPAFGEKHLDFYEERRKQHRDGIREKHSLSENQLEEIILEGATKNWPHP